jgi:hypothetical protein
MDIVMKRITLWQNIRIPIGKRFNGVPDDVAIELIKRSCAEAIAPDIIEQEKEAEAKAASKKEKGTK